MRDIYSTGTTNPNGECNHYVISGVFPKHVYHANLAAERSASGARATDVAHGVENNFRSATHMRSCHDHMTTQWRHPSAEVADFGCSAGRACASSDDVITTSGLSIGGRDHVTGEEFKSCSLDGDTDGDCWSCDDCGGAFPTSGSGAVANDAQYRKQFNSPRRRRCVAATAGDNENDENDNVVLGAGGNQPEVDRRRHRKRKCDQQQQQRHAANQRERKRMKSINEAFEGLRAHIPTLPYEKRLSKVDTLRVAIGYIGFLAELVDAEDQSDGVAGPLAGAGRGLSGRSGAAPKIVIHYHGAIVFSLHFHAKHMRL